jgi:hypothetical protein
MTDRGLFLAGTIFITDSLSSLLGVTKHRLLFYKTCTSPKFRKWNLWTVWLLVYRARPPFLRFHSFTSFYKPLAPISWRLLHSTLSPSAQTLIYPSKATRTNSSKFSKNPAPPSARPNLFLTSRRDSPLSPGSATPSPTLSTLPRGLLRSALLFSTISGPSTRYHHNGPTLQPAKPIFIGWRTWSPCSSRPIYPPPPPLLRLPQRLPPAAASTLRAHRLLNQPRRPLLRRPPPPSHLQRSSTSLGRSAG